MEEKNNKEENNQEKGLSEDENEEKELTEKEKEIIAQKEELRKKMKEEEEQREKKNFEKYRINYLSFKTSRPITDIKSLCPICSFVPNISLSLNSEKGHYVKCQKCRYCYCCSHPKSRTLEDYIRIMAKIQQKNVKCDIHKEKGEDTEGYFSCELCQKWMCEECINNHIKEEKGKDHYYYIIRKVEDKNFHTYCPRHDYKEYMYYIIEDFALGFHCCEECDLTEAQNDPDSDIFLIPKEKGKIFLNQLKEIINNGVEYLDVYCQNIYNILIKSIGSENIELLKKSEQIYNNFLIRNRRALFYYQMVVNAATPSVCNYNLINNISNLLETKFDKINFNLPEKLNDEEIKKILEFFENNYIVGKTEKKLEDIKEFNLKEIGKIIKDEKLIVKKNLKKEEEDKYEKKIGYKGIIILMKKILCAFSEDGYIYTFKIEENCLSGKHLLTTKAHEKQIISADIIKTSENKFVTCDETEIKLWKLINKNNDYNIECELVVKNISDSEILYLNVLNLSNIIALVNENGHFIVLNNSYKVFIKINTNMDLVGLYQIESNDDNDDKLIVAGMKKICIVNILNEKPPIKYLGDVRCDCFSGKSLLYWEKDLLLVGGKGEISIVNIKDFKLDYIINLSSSECSCFLRLNLGILCGYGDTSGCCSWSRGIADDKNTKFLFIRKNKEKYESIEISDIFYNYGIINALWIDKNKFICCFYKDDNLKIFEIK